MVNCYLIDSSAWIEYFLGSEKGAFLKKVFENENNICYTIECCFAEIKEWCIKNNQEFDNKLRIIKSNSSTLGIEERDWIKAAEEKIKQRKIEKDFGLIDAIILTKAKDKSLIIITGDNHFKNIKNTILL